MTSVTIDRTDGLNSAAAIKGPCHAATTANITLAGEQTIDGVAVVTGDRVLVKDQTAASENGVYVVDTGPWRRSKDFNRTRDVLEGTQVYVTDGTTNAGLMFVITTDDPISVGTSSISFSTPRGIGGTLDTVNILDYATSFAQRAAIRNGSVAFNDAWADAAADAQARNISVVSFPSGNFELANNTKVTNPGVYVRGEPGGTRLYKNGSGRMFETLGTAPNTSTDGYVLTANAVGGVANSVTLSPADAANFTAGSRAILWANVITKSDSARDAEYVKIINVNTGTGVITFASPIYFSYATANGAKLFNVDLVDGVGYENLIIDWTDGAPTSPARPPYNVDEAFALWFCENPTLRNISSKYMIAATINLHGCVNAFVDGLYCRDGFSDGTDMTNAYAYGIAESGLNLGLRATNLLFERMRHGTTTGGPDSADPTMFNGGHPFYSLIFNGVHRDAKEAGFDSHDAGVGCRWVNLHTIGGVRSGFQVRDNNRHIIGCSARGIRQAGGAEGHGLYIVGGDTGNQYARDTRIDGFDVYNIAGSAIRDQAPGTIGRRITAELVQGNIISGDGVATGDFEYSDIYGKDVAKNASIGGAYAVALGNASVQKNPRIRDLFVDDPNNNLLTLVRRNTFATDKVEITNARGLNSSKTPIPVASSDTNTSNIMIRDGYGPTGMSNGPTKSVAVASNSIDIGALYAGGVILSGTGPLITIVGGDRESLLRVWGPSSGTITLNHGSSPDNLVLKGAANQGIGNNQCITFERRGSVWIEVSRNF